MKETLPPLSLLGIRKQTPLFVISLQRLTAPLSTSYLNAVALDRDPIILVHLESFGRHFTAKQPPGFLNLALVCFFESATSSREEIPPTLMHLAYPPLHFNSPLSIDRELGQLVIVHAFLWSTRVGNLPRRAVRLAKSSLSTRPFVFPLNTGRYIKSVTNKVIFTSRYRPNYPSPPNPPTMKLNTPYCFY